MTDASKVTIVEGRGSSVGLLNDGMCSWRSTRDAMSAYAEYSYRWNKLIVCTLWFCACDRFVK